VLNQEELPPNGWENLGARRVAEQALELAELLALRLPAEASRLADCAHRMFEHAGDRAGAFIAATIKVCCLARLGLNAEGKQYVTETVVPAYAALRGVWADLPPSLMTDLENVDPSNWSVEQLLQEVNGASEQRLSDLRERHAAAQRARQAWSAWLQRLGSAILFISRPRESWRRNDAWNQWRRENFPAGAPLETDFLEPELGSPEAVTAAHVGAPSPSAPAPPSSQGRSRLSRFAGFASTALGLCIGLGILALFYQGFAYVLTQATGPTIPLWVKIIGFVFFLALLGALPNWIRSLRGWFASRTVLNLDLQSEIPLRTSASGVAAEGQPMQVVLEQGGRVVKREFWKSTPLPMSWETIKSIWPTPALEFKDDPSLSSDPVVSELIRRNRRLGKWHIALPLEMPVSAAGLNWEGFLGTTLAQPQTGQMQMRPYRRIPTPDAAAPILNETLELAVVCPVRWAREIGAAWDKAGVRPRHLSERLPAEAPQRLLHLVGTPRRVATGFRLQIGRETARQMQKSVLAYEGQELIGADDLPEGYGSFVVLQGEPTMGIERFHTDREQSAVLRGLAAEIAATQWGVLVLPPMPVELAGRLLSLLGSRLRHGRSLRLSSLLALIDALRTFLRSAVDEESRNSGETPERAKRAGLELSWEISLFARGTRSGPPRQSGPASVEYD
jgi:hypothetical protein